MDEHEVRALRRIVESQRQMNLGLKAFTRKMRTDFPAFDAAFRDLRAALDRSYRV